MRRWLVPLVMLFAPLVLLACGDGDETPAPTTTTATTTTAPTTTSAPTTTTTTTTAPTTQSFFINSKQASIRSFSVNGSPT